MNRVIMLTFSIRDIKEVASNIFLKEDDRGDILKVVLKEDTVDFTKCSRIELWYKNNCKTTYISPIEVKKNELTFSMDDLIKEPGQLELELNLFENRGSVSTNIISMIVRNALRPEDDYMKLRNIMS